MKIFSNLGLFYLKMYNIFYFFLHCLKGDSLYILKRRGLVFGKNFVLGDRSVLDMGFLHLITIGDNVTLAGNGVTILAHDASTVRWLNYTKIGKVQIGNKVFIGSGSIILPGVTIGDNVVVGAGSVVTHDIPSGSVAKGNPARVTGTIEEFLGRKKQELGVYPKFSKEYLVAYNADKKLKLEMVDKMKDKYGYIV